MENMAGFDRKAVGQFAEKSKVLNSWKEIAAYIGRGVRTVQRWEHELGLPVRRPHAKMRSIVIALSADIDEWLKQRPLRGHRRQSRRRSTLSARREHWEAMLKQSNELMRSVQETRGQLLAAISAISQTISEIQSTKKVASSAWAPQFDTTASL